MLKRYTISKEQALDAIKNGEFGEDIISHQYVIVLLTQDWCSQWVDMKNWIYTLESDKDIRIFELVYNVTDYFRNFMEFKEKIFRNDMVPYLRFYKNGKLVKETNYVGMQGLRRLLEQF